MRQWGAWKLHPYYLVILTKLDKFGATNCYYHPRVDDNLFILTTTLPLLPHIPYNSFLPICAIPHYNTKINKWHTNTDSTTINIFFFFFSLSPFPTFFFFSHSTHFSPFYAFPCLPLLTYQTPPIFYSPASLHTLSFYPKILRYESSTYLIKFPWQYESHALQNIISSAHLTPFATHTLATCIFPFPMTYLLAVILVSTQ